MTIFIYIRKNPSLKDFHILYHACRFLKFFIAYENSEKTRLNASYFILYTLRKLKLFIQSDLKSDKKLNFTKIIKILNAQLFYTKISIILSLIITSVVANFFFYFFYFKAKALSFAIIQIKNTSFFKIKIENKEY